MSHKISYPRSLNLGRLNTPLNALTRLSEKYGREIFVKRDDLTGAALSGNKVRKLDFLLADALEKGAKGVISCGAAQSNHARATAVAAAQLGLKSHLMLRVMDPLAPPPIRGNLLFDALVDAAIEWISADDYLRRDELMAARAKELEKKEGFPYYVIPEGGSNAIGAWGYIRCIEELSKDLGDEETIILCATGSGGTVAGLIAGTMLLNLPYTIIGVAVGGSRDYFQDKIFSILEKMQGDYRLDFSLSGNDINIWENYIGKGYGLSRDEELDCIIECARLEGLIFDPVYSGKAMFGLLEEIKMNNRQLDGAKIVFIHTGGIHSLFASDALSAKIKDS